MAGTELASAYINLQVKMPGVQSSIANALGGSPATSALKSSGSKMGSFLTGALGGAVALGLSKAVTAITSSLNAAISRVDTLNNFPKIMQNLGFSAGDAQKSIDRISKSLTGLPTSLDSMAGVVQQLAPLTGGLDEATDLSLALNNALLAGGKSTEVQANALEQYVQQLAVGKVDMAAWRSMQSAMPGQLDQVSKSLLGASANSTSLYDAMQNGTISFDQFNGAILDLNKNGLGEYASFADQAISATEGIATSQTNLGTAITRGLAALIEKFQPQIIAAMAAVTVAVNASFAAISGLFDWAAANMEWLGPLAAGIAGAAGAVIAWNIATKAWLAIQGAVKAVQAAYIASTYGMTGATYAFNGALAANPIGLIVTAIGAVVAALVYWFTQTKEGQAVWAEFTRFLGEAWANISQFFIDAWENVIQPIFAKIGEIAVWLYENVLAPIFSAIGAVVEWVAAAFKLQFDLIVNAFRLVAAIASWAWINMIQPVFNALAAIVTLVWESYISPIFAAIGSALGVLGDAFNWLWVNVISPVWEGISSTISTVWNWINANVFTPFKTVIASIGTAFENVAKAIGAAWDGIKKAAAAPINFIIGTVWNDGILKFTNSVFDVLGLDDMKLKKASLIKFATGGVLPGYTPGRDVHEFYSPTGGRLALSGGEAIMRPEFTKAVGGAAGVARLNSMARSGQAFADGGIWNNLGSFAGDVWDNITGAASVAWDFISNPAGAIKKHLIDGIIKPLTGGDNAWADIATGIPTMLVTNMSKMFENVAPKGVGTAGMGWEAMWRIVNANVPGAIKTSDYRPGATTVNGGRSYHGMGRAIDLIPASMDTFNAVKRLFPNASELIYSPAGSAQLLNGQPFNGWSDAVRKQHYNHVHLAMANGGVVPKLYDQGGWLPDGGMAVNRSGQPEAVLTPAESRGLREGLSGEGMSITGTLEIGGDGLARIIDGRIVKSASGAMAVRSEFAR